MSTGRKLVFLCLVGTLVGVLGLVSNDVEAQIDELLYGLGGYGILTKSRVDSPRELNVNGQRMLFVSGTVQSSLTEFFDEYERRCPKQEFIEVPVLIRSEGENRGWAVCLKPAERSKNGLLTRLSKFSENGNISELGTLEYVYAQPHDGRVDFVTIRPKGAMFVDQLLPTRGDVGGKDIEGIPRPPKARRVGSVWEQGENAAIVVYTQNVYAQDRMANYYKRVLKDAGWSVSLRGNIDGRGVLVFSERDGRLVALLFSDKQGTGVVTVLDMN